MKTDIERAFALMLANQPVNLSEEGKRKLEECWEDGSKCQWYISAVNVDDSVRMTSENHLIYTGAPLSWLILDK
jgi:hypothetical protein